MVPYSYSRTFAEAMRIPNDRRMRARHRKDNKMLGSMYSAVSGLSAHQMKMNVIGNNIANVNTYGFKSSRVTFSDVFYQTISAASTPTSSAGGTNPAQLGYGAMVKSIDVINTRAGSATTDRPLDVYINGEGYLPVKDSGGVIRYTRVGVLSFDVAGNLVDSSGNMVLGLALDATTGKPVLGANGTVSAKDLVPISVNPADMDKYTGISISSKGEITAIKEGDPVITPAANTGWLTTASVDPATLYSGNIMMSIERVNANVQFLNGTYEGTDNLINGVTVPVSADINGKIEISRDSSDVYTLHYKDKNGKSFNLEGTPDLVDPTLITFTVNDIAGGGATVDISVIVGADPATQVNVANNGVSMTIGHAVAEKIDINILTFDKSGTEVKLQAYWDSSAPHTPLVFGDMTYTLDPTRFGALMDFSNVMAGSIGPGAGVPSKIANLAIVNFTNADGLSQTGEGYYVETENSGQPVGTIPGDQGTGSLRSGALEMSNVDLSREFTEMIIAQRGFQANTRMITVSDEMLSELVNMKR